MLRKKNLKIEFVNQNMPKSKKEKKEKNEKNNVLRHLEIKKKEEPKEESEEEQEEKVVRSLTTEEKENMKSLIPLLEEHEQVQLFHFIRMDNIKHTIKQNGILLNLKNTNDEFIYKIYKYINKCIEEKKYRI